VNLLITNSRASYYVGGTEVVSLHQAIELARLGHSIDYVVRESTAPSEYFLDFHAIITREHLPITIHSVAIDAPLGDGKSWVRWNQEALSFAVAALPLYLSKQPTVDLFVAHLVTDTIGLPLGARSVLHLHGSPQQPDMLIDSAMGRVTHAMPTLIPYLSGGLAITAYPLLIPLETVSIARYTLQTCAPLVRLTCSTWAGFWNTKAYSIFSMPSMNRRASSSRGAGLSSLRSYRPYSVEDCLVRQSSDHPTMKRLPLSIETQRFSPVRLARKKEFSLLCSRLPLQDVPL